MVLDAVDSLTADAAQSALAQATAFQKGLETFLSDCAAQGAGCPLGAGTAKATGTLDATVAQLDRKSARTASGADFTSGDLRTAITNSLYAEQLWPTLAQGIATLHDKGDPAVLDEINKQFAGRTRRATAPTTTTAARRSSRSTAPTTRCAPRIRPPNSPHWRRSSPRPPRCSARTRWARRSPARAGPPVRTTSAG